MPQEVTVMRLCSYFHWTTEEAYRMLSPPWGRRTVAMLDAKRVCDVIDEWERVHRANSKKVEKTAKKNKNMTPEAAMAKLEAEGGLDKPDVSKDSHTFVQYVIDCARTLTDAEYEVALTRRSS